MKFIYLCLCVLRDALYVVIENRKVTCITKYYNRDVYYIESKLETHWSGSARLIAYSVAMFQCHYYENQYQHVYEINGDDEINDDTGIQT